MFGFGRKRAAPGTRLGDRSSVVVRQSENAGWYHRTQSENSTHVAESGRVNRPISARNILNPMGPLFYPKGFRGFVGIQHTRAARIISIFESQGYPGILPTDKQPKAIKRQPYE